jgi:hypothetical protein
VCASNQAGGVWRGDKSRQPARDSGRVFDSLTICSVEFTLIAPLRATAMSDRTVSIVLRPDVQLPSRDTAQQVVAPAVPLVAVDLPTTTTPRGPRPALLLVLLCAVVPVAQQRRFRRVKRRHAAEVVVGQLVGDLHVRPSAGAGQGPHLDNGRDADGTGAPEHGAGVANRDWNIPLT